MDRRTFLAAASATAISTGLHSIPSFAELDTPKLQPMALGLLISPFGEPEATIKRVHDMGFSNCFLSLDGYINKFTADAAKEIADSLAKYQVVATTVEVVGPGPLEWNFLQGPSTIGVVPPKTRAARIDALRQVSDFAKLLDIPQVQTHCGFIPEDPTDALYPQAVEAIRKVAEHCHANGQYFLMETGQETPTTMSRVIRDANLPNLAVGLDTANLILYGKANPVGCRRHHRRSRPQRPCKGRQVADRSEQARRRSADRQRAGRFQDSIHQAAQARLYRCNHD